MLHFGLVRHFHVLHMYSTGTTAHSKLVPFKENGSAYQELVFFQRKQKRHTVHVLLDVTIIITAIHSLH